MAAHTLFFTWQSETPTAWGGNLIEGGLTIAKDKLMDALAIEPAIGSAGLAVDRDTRGIPGSPPIVDEIFKKIDKAFAFVADVTFVGKRLDGRPTPNPNVLLEYGRALKSPC